MLSHVLVNRKVADQRRSSHPPGQVALVRAPGGIGLAGVGLLALLLASASRAQVINQDPEPMDPPVAILECEVPNLETFVVHGSMPVPFGFQFDPVNCPFSVYDKFDNRLPTQWEPIAYRADGSLMVVEMLAVATRGTMGVGSRKKFEVREDPSSDPPLSIAQAAAFVSQLTLRTEDVHGNKYEGAFSLAELFRLGAAQSTAEWTTRLLPVDPSAPNVLEQLGAAQAWLSTRAGTNVYELALNFHNGSSSHPSWNLYFKNLELVMPSGSSAISMWPEPMAGSVYTEGSTRVLPLIRPIPTGEMHFIEQRHERGFRYFLYPTGSEGFQHASQLRTRVGWAVTLDEEVNSITGERTWSFENEETPGIFRSSSPCPT